MNASLNGYLKSRQLAGNSMGGGTQVLNAGQGPPYANYLSGPSAGQSAQSLLGSKAHN